MDPDIPDASTIVRFSALVKKKVSVVPKNIMYSPSVKNFKKFSKVFLSISNSFHHHHSVTASSQKIRRYSSPVVMIFSSSYALLKV